MKSFCCRALSIALLTACAFTVGCSHSTEVLGRNTQTFQMKGTVLASDPATGMITLQHDAVPGFMDAMTMPYKLDRPEIARELHPGDVIRARLLVDKDPDGVYHGARLNEIAIIAQKNLDVKPTSQYHVPAKGDAVPAFSLIDQDGHAMSLAALKGKAVLLTFIYTRCPLGDFCPKMTRNFQEIRGMVQKVPALQSRTDFVSVSFDPAYDTPAVLRSYGKNYVGGDGFAHWQFVRAKDQATLTAMEQFFNIGATPESNGSLTHSLSTVLIGPDGRISDWLPGSEWSPKDAFDKLQALATK